MEKIDAVIQTIAKLDPVEIQRRLDELEAEERQLRDLLRIARRRSRKAQEGRPR